MFFYTTHSNFCRIKNIAQFFFFNLYRKEKPPMMFLEAAKYVSLPEIGILSCPPSVLYLKVLNEGSSEENADNTGFCGFVINR